MMLFDAFKILFFLKLLLLLVSSTITRGGKRLTLSKRPGTMSFHLQTLRLQSFCLPYVWGCCVSLNMSVAMLGCRL